MRVQVKLFGPFALMSGRKEFPVETDKKDLSVEDFLFLLSGKLPQIRKSLEDVGMEQFLSRRVLLVINGMPCADKSKLLSEGDEIKILTPVAGG
jgi:molybdopterin converting factor small subunit